MLKLDTRADLERIIHERLPESLILDYKRSDALKNDDKSRNELCKDVSAFANSAGGQIIYGIPEVNHVPQPLDSGVDKSTITPEWIEHVLNSRIQPIIDGLLIKHIPISDDHTRVAYVLNIPQSTSRAPHQASDRKYYKRYNFESVAMADYEIRDILGRSSTLQIEIIKTEFDSNMPSTFYVDVMVANPGVPTIVRDWQMIIQTPESTVCMIPEHIHAFKKLERASGVDMIEVSKDVIQQGDERDMRLAFNINRELRKRLEAKGWTITIEARDVRRKQVRATKIL
jgi:hypothetical protein